MFISYSNSVWGEGERVGGKQVNAVAADVDVTLGA